MKTLIAQEVHRQLMEDTVPSMSYRGGDFSAWQAEARAKLGQLLGMQHLQKVKPDLRIERVEELEDHTEIRFLFASEAYADVVCELWIPKTGREPYPLVICLQGHSTGMHISLGRPRFPGDEETIAGGDRDFARQIIREGYASLAIEQRCFGERGGKPEGPDCHQSTMSALLLGRTTIGERVWDVSRAIDVVESSFPQIDAGRIACMGNSGGGTVTYYAACMEQRISIAMPSCAVCSYRHSIENIRHCVCNYIPGILPFFEMGDLSGLIAPRPLVIVAGAKDPSFRLEGVREVLETAKPLYAAAGAPDKVALVEGPEGHRFYADLSWPVFRRLSGWGKD